MTKYIWHTDVNTGNSHRSYRSEASDTTIAILKIWLNNRNQKENHIILDNYVCQANKITKKYAVFTIYRLSDDRLIETDIIKLSICSHNRRAAQAWQALNGQGELPLPPFCAIKIIENNIISDDLTKLPEITNFEHHLAWAWLEWTDEKENNNEQ